MSSNPKNKFGTPLDGDVLLMLFDHAQGATTLSELRQVQSVLLTDHYHLSIEDAADAMGVSQSWLYAARAATLRSGGIPIMKHSRGGRTHGIFQSKKEETKFMNSYKRQTREDERNFKDLADRVRAHTKTAVRRSFVYRLASDHGVTLKKVSKKGLEKVSPD